MCCGVETVHRLIFSVAVAIAVSGCGAGELRYGYNDNGVALHWNEISAIPAWDAYPVQPSLSMSLEELHAQGVKMLRVRVQGVDSPASHRISTDGVVMESSLAPARSTDETTTTGDWTKTRQCSEIDFLLRR